MLHKESQKLLPEQKTFLLPKGNYKLNSVENLNEKLITASDMMSRIYDDLYDMVTQLTSLDDECEEYHGDIELNNDIIMSASFAYHAHKMIDQKIINANPNFFKMEER